MNSENRTRTLITDNKRSPVLISHDDIWVERGAMPSGII